MHSLKPTTKRTTTWLLPNLLPQAELVLLDAPSGTGKTVLLANIASQLSHQSTRPILVLTTPNQRDLFIEHLEKHQPDYNHLQGLDLPTAKDENTPLTEQIYQFLKSTLTQHNPQLLLIDSLEELLAPLSPPGRGVGGEGDPSRGEAHPIHLHTLWQNLRQLAHESNCTILIPRTHGHHESRQYTPFTRYGSDATRFALTMLYHPHDTSIRIITRAKNQRGSIGEQHHLFFTPTGNTLIFQADYQHHVRPTRTPNTWTPTPRNLIEDNDIIELAQILMLGQPTPVDEVVKYLAPVHPLLAIRRALAQSRMQLANNGHQWLYLPTPQMIERAPHLRAELLKKAENKARTHPNPTPIQKPKAPEIHRQTG